MDSLSAKFEQFVLKKNHASYRPSRMLFLDTETKVTKQGDIEEHRMDMAWTCYLKKRHDQFNDKPAWNYWESSRIMWQYIENLARPKTNLYIFGHNIFFDLQCSGFFPWFTKRGWQLGFHYDKGLTYILYIKKGTRKIRCLSTTNYFATSLKNMGDLIGLPKLDIDFVKSSRKHRKIYCKRDVEITKAIMEYYFAFLDKHDAGKFMASRSGQAFTCFRHRFMDRKIHLHRDKDLDDFERKAYHGGRVDCFHIGKPKGGPFVSLDVNSMYSFVMRTFRYPTRAVDLLEDVDHETLGHCLNDFAVVAECWLDTDEPAYAVRSEDKIIYPTGTFKANLCSQGVRYALDNKHLWKVNKISVYEKDWIFKEYVDYFYALRKQYSKEKNAIMKTITKDFLNHLYGKFAQKTPLIDEEVDLTYDGYWKEEVLDFVTGKKETVTKLLNKQFTVWGEESAKSSFVAVAAHVTEYARFVLWQIIKDIGPENVLYCDTDSIKIRQKDLGKLSYPIDAYQLGALKVEETFKSFWIYGPKDYRTESAVKLKGVPKKAVKLPDGSYEYLSFPSQETHLRKRITDHFMARIVRKRLKRNYTKGMIMPSGQVMPFRLEFPLPPASQLQ